MGSKQSWKQWEELTHIVVSISTKCQKFQKTHNPQSICFEQDSIESKINNVSQHECPNMACDTSPQEGTGVSHSASLKMKMVFGLWPFVLNVVPDDSIPANSVQNLMMRFRDIWSVLHHPEQFGFLPTRKRCAAFQQWPDWFRRHAVLNSNMIACFKVVRAQ